MRPHLALAAEIRTEIVDLLGGPNDLSAQEIGELAYQKVLRAKVDEARDEVAARYEQEHRRSLYERLLGEIATSEGETISEQVKTKVETDPKLALDLQESARRELAARAQEVVRSKITGEQAEVINREADRQVELDRFDVRLALDRELDLKDAHLKESVKPGDIVELFFKNTGGRRGRLILTWTKDAKGHEGWLFTSCSEPLVNKDNSTLTVRADKFISIGCKNKDLQEGTDIIEADKLCVGLPIVLLQANGKHPSQISLNMGRHDSYNHFNTNQMPLVLEGTDFQTKSIIF